MSWHDSGNCSTPTHPAAPSRSSEISPNSLFRNILPASPLFLIFCARNRAYLYENKDHGEGEGVGWKPTPINALNRHRVAEVAHRNRQAVRAGTQQVIPDACRSYVPRQRRERCHPLGFAVPGEVNQLRRSFIWDNQKLMSAAARRHDEFGNAADGLMLPEFGTCGITKMKDGVAFPSSDDELVTNVSDRVGVLERNDVPQSHTAGKNFETAAGDSVDVGAGAGDVMILGFHAAAATTNRNHDSACRQQSQAILPKGKRSQRLHQHAANAGHSPRVTARRSSDVGKIERQHPAVRDNDRLRRIAQIGGSKTTAGLRQLDRAGTNDELLLDCDAARRGRNGQRDLVLGNVNPRSRRGRSGIVRTGLAAQDTRVLHHHWVRRPRSVGGTILLEQFPSAGAHCERRGE